VVGCGWFDMVDGCVGVIWVQVGMSGLVDD
jgi:hypothetical protein